MLVSKKLVTLHKWNMHLRNMQDFKNSAFALIAHPEATPEQIELVVFKAREMQKEHDEMKRQLIKEGYDV